MDAKLQRRIRKALLKASADCSPTPRFTVPMVLPDSVLGERLRQEVEDRTPHFLAKLDLNKQDWSADEWESMVTIVRNFCESVGLTIREDGTLAAFEAAICSRERPFVKPNIRVLIAGEFAFALGSPSAENGFAHAPAIIVIV